MTVHCRLSGGTREGIRMRLPGAVVPREILVPRQEWDALDGELRKQGIEHRAIFADELERYTYVGTQDRVVFYRCAKRGNYP